MTHRIIPDYFGGSAAVELDYQAGGWVVRFWCPVLKRWDWEHLQTSRKGEKLKKEALAAALKLAKESLERRRRELEEHQRKYDHLTRRLTLIESGQADWSSL